MLKNLETLIPVEFWNRDTFALFPCVLENLEFSSHEKHMKSDKAECPRTLFKLPQTTQYSSVLVVHCIVL